MNIKKCNGIEKGLFDYMLTGQLDNGSQNGEEKLSTTPTILTKIKQ